MFRKKVEKVVNKTKLSPILMAERLLLLSKRFCNGLNLKLLEKAKPGRQITVTVYLSSGTFKRTKKKQTIFVKKVVGTLLIYLPLSRRAMDSFNIGFKRTRK